MECNALTNSLLIASIDLPCPLGGNDLGWASDHRRIGPITAANRGDRVTRDTVSLLDDQMSGAVHLSELQEVDSELQTCS
jgi:hypothetical protein